MGRLKRISHTYCTLLSLVVSFVGRKTPNNSILELLMEINRQASTTEGAKLIPLLQKLQVS